MIQATSKNSISILQRPTLSALALLLGLLILAESGLTVEIHNFTPQYEPRLRLLPNGQQMLEQVDTFLNNSKRDKQVLDQIMTSGYVYGHHDYEQINGIFEFLLRTHPELVKGFHPVGKSFEQNNIMAIRIGKQNGSQKEFYNSVYSEPINSNRTDNEPGAKTHKSMMFFNGAHHSRELITSGMILRIALEAMHNLLYASGNELSFWEFSDLLMIPFVNIDASKFISDSQRLTDDFLTPINNSWANETGNKMPKYEIGKFKRKNMNTSYCKSSKDGVNIGVDLNRNYGYEWGQNTVNNRDKHECEGVYSGPNPFSEPETSTVRDLVLREKEFIVLALNFHSYGNDWLIPYSFSGKRSLESFGLDEHIINYYESAKKKIKEVCPNALVGNVVDLIGYTSYGEASDWMLGEAGVVAFSPELGFLNEDYDDFWLPKDLINPSLDENFKVIQFMAEDTKFQISSSTAYLDTQNNMIVEFENKTLGKVFEARVRIEASDVSFYTAINSMAIKQNNKLNEAVSVNFYDGEGQKIWTKTDENSQMPEDVGSRLLSSEAYIEVNVAMLDKLSKISVIMDLNEGTASLGEVDFVVTVLFDEIYELSKFQFTQVFNQNSFWEIGFWVAVVLNLFFMLVFMLSQCSFAKKQGLEKKEQNGSLKEERVNASADIQIR